MDLDAGQARKNWFRFHYMILADYLGSHRVVDRGRDLSSSIEPQVLAHDEMREGMNAFSRTPLCRLLDQARITPRGRLLR
jgi:hypothetical protein